MRERKGKEGKWRRMVSSWSIERVESGQRTACLALAPLPANSLRLSFNYLFIYFQCRRTTAIWKSHPPTMYLTSTSRLTSRHPPLISPASFKSVTT